MFSSGGLVRLHMGGRPTVRPRQRPHEIDCWHDEIGDPTQADAVASIQVV